MYDRRYLLSASVLALWQWFDPKHADEWSRTCCKRDRDSWSLGGFMLWVGRYLRTIVLGICDSHISATKTSGVLVPPRHLSPSILNEIADTHISRPHQHTELVVIWVHPPGGPGWGGARDLDFLIKESIMRIRNRRK